MIVKVEYENGVKTILDNVTEATFVKNNNTLHLWSNNPSLVKRVMEDVIGVVIFTNEGVSL